MCGLFDQSNVFSNLCILKYSVNFLGARKVIINFGKSSLFGKQFGTIQ